MKTKPVTFLTLALLIVSALVGWSLLATPASGSGPMRQDATSQQQTIDAVVNGYFTQTAQAQQQIGVTQTIQAAFDQALTATAGFDATVQAQFGALQTATAAAIPIPTVAAETLQAAEIIELPLPAGPGRSGAYLAPDGNRIAYISTQGNILCILDIADVADHIQKSVNSGMAFEDALDGMTDHPDQFPGVVCLSLENIPGSRLDVETIRWSPDGRYLAMTEEFFLTFRDSDIWVVDTQSMTLADITDDGSTQGLMNAHANDPVPPVDVQPRWLPDDRLLFLRYVRRDDPVYVNTVLSDGSQLRQAGQLDVPAGFVVTTLAVSAQGKLAYSLWNNGARSGIWISDLDGGNSRQVWHNAEIENVAPLALDWSPDGTMLAFALSRPGGDPIPLTPKTSRWSAMRVGDGQETFFSPDQPVLNAGWSPDGRTIVYTTAFTRDPSSVGLYIAAAPGAPGRMLIPAEVQRTLGVTTGWQLQLIPWTVNNTVMVGRLNSILIIRLAAP